MPLLVKLNIDQESCQIPDNGEYWPEEDGIYEELIETYGLQEITEADLPKPLSNPSDISVRLFKKNSQGITEYLGLR